MALTREDKAALMTELTEVANTSLSAVVADYRGLTVSEMTELRSRGREANVVVRVFRNTLARRAVAETSFACLTETLVGPTVLLFAKEDPGAAARLMRDFTKDHEAIEVRALALDGALLGADQLKAVASLPTYDEAIAQVMSVMNAPVTKFVRTLSETYAQLVRVVAAVAEAKK